MPGGRPTAYRPEFEELAYNYCLLGATDEQLASFFNVCTTTIDTWKRDIPEFLGSLKRGKAFADAQMAASLYNKGIGYTRSEDKVFMYKGCESVVPVDVYYPADTTSIIFWLKNRQPELWRDRHDINHSGAMANSDMDEEELDRRLQELQDQLEQSEQT